jgi:beta-1,4-mannosyl-glycoprotein beta-1,4-N-acetylglucosaminyltransferase
MLEIHLAELYDVVDKFIILESTVTYSGQPKPLHFKENKARYGRFSDKIHYATFESSDTASFSFAPGDFAIETQQRGYMTGVINDLFQSSGLGVGELIVLVADVDEIPYEPTLRLIKTCSLPPTLHLQLVPFIYSFEWISGDLDSWHIQTHTWDPSTSYYKHSSKSTNDYITHAGVHCSFCFEKIEDFQWKMKAYSHNDRLGDHPKALLREDRIQKAVCNGENIFG